MKERIATMIQNAVDGCARHWAEIIADYLIKKGVIEVVRCNECRYYKTDTPYCKEHNKGYCDWDGVIKTKKHFCGYGERKDDNN